MSNAALFVPLWVQLAIILAFCFAVVLSFSL